MKKIISIAFTYLVFGNVLFVFGQDVQTLQPNQSITREMTGKATHQYKFDLKADEFFQVRVEQKGVDVQLKLLDSSGNVLATMDSPNGKEGFEILTFVADKDGSLVLGIISPNEKAEKGTYILKRQESRVANEKDRKRIEVQKIFVEGMMARDSGQNEIAITKLKEALVGWEELKDDYLKTLTAQQVSYLTPIPSEIVTKLNELNSEISRGNKIIKEGYKTLTESPANFSEAFKKFNESLDIFQSVENQTKNEELRKSVIQIGGEAFLTFESVEMNAKFYKSIVYNAISETHRKLGQWNESIEMLKKAIEASKEWVENTSYKNNPIIPKQIFTIGKHQIAQNFDLIAAAFTRLRQDDDSIKYRKLAIQEWQVLFKNTQDKKIKLEEANSLTLLGHSYNQPKNRKEAIESYNQALAIYETFPTLKRKIAEILFYKTNVYFNEFDYKLTLEVLQKALKIYEEINDKIGQADIYHRLGAIYWVLNDKNKTENFFKQELQILESAEYYNSKKKLIQSELPNQDSWDERFEALLQGSKYSDIGFAYYFLEDYPKALEAFEKSLKFSQSSKQALDVDSAFGNIGMTLAKMNKWQESVKYYKQVYEITSGLGSKLEIASAAYDVGKVLFDDGKYENAFKYLNESLLNYESLGIGEGKDFIIGYSSLLFNLAQTHYALGNKRLAILYGKRAVNAMQSERQRLQNLDPISQKGFLKKKEKHYRRLAEWLIEDGKFAQAEQVLKLLKEEEFSNFVRRDANEIATLNQRIKLDDDEQKVLEKYNALATKVSEYGQEFYALEQKSNLLNQKGLKLNDEDEKRYQKLGEDLKVARDAFQLFLDKELVKEIGESRKEKIEKQQSDRQILGELGKGTVTLYTVVGEERTRVILTTPTVQTDGKYDIKAEELNKKVFAFRDALKNPNVDPRPLGKELYDILLKPIEKDLKTSKAKTLLWYLDGTLRYIPLAALSPDGKKYLVEDYQNVVLTSKTNNLNNQESNKSQKVLGLGVSQAETVDSPILGKIPFPALSGTKRELFSIVSDETANNETGIISGKRFLDENFTTENFQNSLRERKYNIVHIASHFYLGSKDATSFLLLGNGKYLPLNEIKGSSFIKFGGVDLVTLSACNTAFADSSNGAEVDSLADIIQTQGGKSVMATLWAVEDESTSLLMSEFYRIRKESPNLTKAEAIQQAQKRMIEGKLKPQASDSKSRAEIVGSTNNTNGKPFFVDKDKPFAHPYYWSPFVLIGNWR